MKTNDLKEDISKLEHKLLEKKRELARLEQNCQHIWGDAQPDHIYEDAYMIPGDEPGTMGIDWQGPTYVPAKTTYRWKRICSKCGKTEHTVRSDKISKTVPIF